MSTNQFSYKQVWTADFQKSNWAVPVYPVIADLQFTAGLKVGDTVNRRKRTNPIFARTLGSNGSYSPQNYTEGVETFTIAKQREASVTIVDTEVLHTDLPTTKSYGVQLSNAIYQEIDGDTLNAARAGAGQTIDAGTLGGTAGEGITVSISNIAQIPVMANEKLVGTNVQFAQGMRFGKLPYEDYGGMLTWIIPPQVKTVVDLYFMARGTPQGDAAQTNGYNGVFGQWNMFVSNNLPFTTRLALSVNPTDGDTMTIKGVTFRFKNTLGANGDIKIGAAAADTNDNIVAALNALTTTTANFDAWESTDTVTENGLTVSKADALHGLVATDGTTYVDILMKGTGKVSVSSSFTSGSNLFTAAMQCVHGIFMVAKNVSLAVRKDPEIKQRPTPSAVISDDFIMWTVYDNKVFTDQARAIIDFVVRCDSASFAAYSNIHA